MITQRNSGRYLFVPVLAILAAAGCLDVTELEETFRWTGVLVPTDDAPGTLEGSVGLVIGPGQTQVGIGITGGEPGTTLGWRIRNGMCSGDGEPIVPAPFPAVVITEEGAGALEARIAHRIDDAEEGPFAGEVFANADGTGNLLACADLNLDS